jgi:hypothetical protein
MPTYRNRNTTVTKYKRVRMKAGNNGELGPYLVFLEFGGEKALNKYEAGAAINVHVVCPWK